jgi:CPA2 family monovalent cation:H+ antiporter-2
MPHDITLFTTISAALGLGLVFGWIAVRLRLPALVGYLVAGIIIGPATPGFVVLVGYGRVGERIAHVLTERGVSIVVAEQNRELVERLRARGIAAASGAATQPDVLIQAHVARAKMPVIAIPDAFGARKTLEIARPLKPNIETVVSTRSDEDATLLRAEKARELFIGEHELALGMTRYVLERVTAAAA